MASTPPPTRKKPTSDDALGNTDSDSERPPRSVEEYTPGGSRASARAKQKRRTLNDKFLLGEEIGKGAFGFVYKGVDMKACPPPPEPRPAAYYTAAPASLVPRTSAAPPPRRRVEGQGR